MHVRGHLLPLPLAVMSDVYLLGKLKKKKKSLNLRAGRFFNIPTKPPRLYAIFALQLRGSWRATGWESVLQDPSGLAIPFPRASVSSLANLRAEPIAHLQSPLQPGGSRGESARAPGSERTRPLGSRSAPRGGTEPGKRGERGSATLPPGGQSAHRAAEGGT